MHQPVDWHEWGAEAFALAAEEDKPILLDIGAVWCHWCHVMDRESYEDPELAEVINQNFIAVKVDRDERPDVDTRYQAAVAAISGQNGWPLTAVLTPDGQPFFGGTYFPRDDRYGRPGFERVLRTMADAWRRAATKSWSPRPAWSRPSNTTRILPARGQLSLDIVDKMVASAMESSTATTEGLGRSPSLLIPRPRSAARCRRADGE